MVQYRVTGSLVFTKTSAGNATRNAMQSVLNSYPTASGSVGGSGSTVTIDVIVPDEGTATAIQLDLVPGWSPRTRVSGGISVDRMEG